MSERKVHLVSFADGPFRARREPFIKQALSMDIFASVQVFDESLLDKNWRSKHVHFLKNNTRGFGYWIWKPQVLLQVFENCSEGDFVVYMDAGFTLNPAGRPRFQDYLAMASSHPTRRLGFSNTHTEYRWTKADLARRLNVEHDPQVMFTTQIAAGLVVLANCADNIDLVREWAALAVEENYHYSDDSPSSTENHMDFFEHRHDASIFSLLRKIRGTALTHYEVQNYPQFESLKATLPFWATRSKS